MPTDPTDASPHLPLFLHVAGRACVVIGGGEVASRKACWFARAGARVSVIAPRLAPPLAALVAGGAIAHRARRFCADDLTGAWLVIAATDDAATNAAVAAEASRRDIPVNVVDDPARSTFIVPAVVERGPVTVAISTGGRAPVLATRLRAMIEALLPANYGAIATFMGTRRGIVKSALPAVRDRRLLWQTFLDSAAIEGLLAGDVAGADAELARLVSGTLTDEPPVLIVLPISSVDPDDMSLRALRHLMLADRLVSDTGVPLRLRAFARRDACVLELPAATPDDRRQAALASALAEGGLTVYMTVMPNEALGALLQTVGRDRVRIV